MNTSATALERVLALSFHDVRRSNEPQIAIHLLLMKEYLRRMLLWKKALKIEQWPFENLAGYFVKLPPSEYEQIIQLLQKFLFQMVVLLLPVWHLYYGAKLKNGMMF